MRGVSSSGYYRWKQKSERRKARESADLADFQKILEAYEHRGYDKGVLGIKARLQRQNPPIIMNPKKIRRLMHKYGLRCPIRKANPYRRMAKAMQTNQISPNRLARRFKAYAPRQVLLTDITYLKVRSNYVYLSVIMDLCTKQILSYEISDSLKVDFVLRTVEKLIKCHGTSFKDSVMIHSDQGCHYTSIAFRELIQRKDLIQSMSRRGNCWDNAPQESFFGHMKEELRKYMRNWTSIQDVIERIEDWMDYYNTERYQIGLEMMAPDEYYRYLTQGILPTGLK